MHPDFDVCYRAVASRDTRFDGRFYTAVVSTRIYCRPSCPARIPLARNVRFYTAAAAAEADGFRACRRCRPEVSPDAPDWDLRADLVGRALRLIAEGVVDEEGIPGLASRLAVGARHLHRLFVAELGVGPLAVARSRRAQMARQLLDHTALPVTQVAFAAGFSSVRQFNHTVRSAHDRTPTQLRAGSGSAGGEALVLRLAYRPPLPFDDLLAFLAARAVPGVEEVDAGRYRRTVGIDGKPAVLELEPVPARRHVLLRLRTADPCRLAPVVQRARRLFDLTADPSAVDAVLSDDPLLAAGVARRPGLRVPGAYDGFELAVRAVLGQQVSVAAASTLTGRLVAALGTPLDRPDGGLTHLFPGPETVAEADLDGMGVPGRRAAAVRALAAAVCAGDVVLDGPAEAGGARQALLRLPGIGPWTVAYVAMRAFRDPDAMPASDLGLLRALGRAGAGSRSSDLELRAERWRPWRSYAAMHLWASLAPTRKD
ncbi:MAG: DNA-3-methyladenine glycosylase 2 family protein [Euzebyaceae bacterium]|nr:DNA-3-methyladenine glycosylase 2 family protein [Euzebyaceae bacterium]